MTHTVGWGHKSLGWHCWHKRAVAFPGWDWDPLGVRDVSTTGKAWMQPQVLVNVTNPPDLQRTQMKKAMNNLMSLIS